LTGESFFLLLSVFLCFYNLKAALSVFILPLIFIRFAMMAGNWAQHAFIDAAKPPIFTVTVLPALTVSIIKNVLMMDITLVIICDPTCTGQKCQ
jgi:hypothetical protein